MGSVRPGGRPGPAFLIALLLAGASARAADGPRPVRADVVVDVPDMTCDLCAWSIREKLLALPPVARVRIDVDARRAFVEVKPGKTLTDAALREAVSAAGFEPGAVRRSPGEP